ncbi:alpha/beta fold hydrolase [Nocardia jejuensis]|uniref:alpha/beta fold hydrolase n=1 Tax=Nocardia jejuensis TaxID=328049 RepID=UPI000835CF91|nr:alpha/beta hydrolase [Nocardia jejuensis]
MVVREMPIADGVEHRYVDVDGLRMHVALAGAGEPLVLLHGWPQHWWQWRHVIGPLSQHYRVICPDLRGLGWTDAPSHGYIPGTMADDVIGLLDRLGVERFHVLGHDWGGLIGYLLALRYPHRVQRYIALNTASPFLRPTARVLAGGPRLWHIVANAAPVLGPRIASSAMPKWALRHWTYRSATMTSTDRQIFSVQFEEPARARATVSYYRNLLLREIPRLLAGQYRWSRLTVPTLVLAGDRDPLFPISALAEFGSRATDLRVAVMPDVGHFPATEQPARVVEHAVRFLS